MTMTVGAAVSTKPLMGKRIFIFEDNPYNLTGMTIILDTAGCKTFFDRCWNGGSLDKLVGTLPIDLVLMDLNLAYGKSGYEIFELIRSDDRLKDIPVVLVTASDPGSALKVAKERGMNGVIGKPIRVDTFTRMVVDIVIHKKTVWNDGRFY